ncbi:MAG TPA: hypothetical protein VMU66_10690 [Gaiellales bacterium]|nr:hypothetical protein [Gaiellales bacterium]
MRGCFVTIAATLLLAAACGQPAGGSGSVPTGPPPGVPGTISGVYRAGRSSAGPLQGVAGVRIGLYLRAISLGPVMIDPPRPVRVTVTAAGGSFTFTGLASRRYFVSPIAPGAYAPGRWVRPGGAVVVIVGCTACPVPL